MQSRIIQLLQLSITLAVALLGSRLLWPRMTSADRTLVLVLLIIFVLVSVYSFWSRPLPRGLIILAGIALVAWAAWSYYQQHLRLQAVEALELKLSRLKWIAYEPLGFNPTQPDENIVRPAVIEAQLDAVRKEGFDGLITFASDPISSEIPAIAVARGFDGVIMGIDKISEEDLKVAIDNRDNVDGYSVLHDQEARDSSPTPAEIVQAMDYLWSETRRPVTTTLRTDGYRAFPQLAEASDFLFPDVHATWYSLVDPDRLSEETVRLVESVTGLRNELYPDKPILLKMISAPRCAVPGASESARSEYFMSMVEQLKLKASAPARVYLSVFSAYDARWKTSDEKWPKGEDCLGLFDGNNDTKSYSPRESVNVLNWPIPR